MGRASDTLHGPCRIERMTMVDGDYDEGGAYWGAGNPGIGWMYVAEDSEGNQAFTRGGSRDDAVREFMEHHPEADFGI